MKSPREWGVSSDSSAPSCSSGSSSAGASRKAREDGVADIVRAGLPTAEWDEGPVLGTTGERVMFDAAYSGSEAGTHTDSAALELAMGRHRVDSASIDPDDEPSLSRSPGRRADLMRRCQVLRMSLLRIIPAGSICARVRTRLDRRPG
ncbi:Imm21 family immunity protein [Embleya sp. NPDC056575]|uniref:Imm21 family immunity protein n=1 Tax=unclassified Embleya TaxID=2699296 RepID=UPI0036C7DCAA